MDGAGVGEGKDVKWNEKMTWALAVQQDQKGTVWDFFIYLGECL